jgi:hypothetical protein
MTKIARIDLNAGSSVLTAMSVDDLRAELAKTLEVTARHLAHLAEVWRELERRGEDLSDLRSGLWTYMPMIARGDLRAEMVVRYAGSLMLLRAVARLPLADQDRLLEDGTVTLVEVGEQGLDERQVPLHLLKMAQIPRVIRDRIVSAEEQKQALAGTSVRVKRRAPRGPRAKAIVAARGRRYRDPSKSSHPTSLSLTDDEWEQLQAAAKSANLPVASLIAGALEAAGLLAGGNASTSPALALPSSPEASA